MRQFKTCSWSCGCGIFQRAWGGEKKDLFWLSCSFQNEDKEKERKRQEARTNSPKTDGDHEDEEDDNDEEEPDDTRQTPENASSGERQMCETTSFVAGWLDVCLVDLITPRGFSHLANSSTVLQNLLSEDTYSGVT